jgi:glycosyltransferase involved in cell wall biosynthesis
MKSLAWLPLGLLRLRRLLHELNVQVVNFHYIGDGALSVALLRRLGLYRGKLVLSVHGTDVRLPDTRIGRAIYRIVLANADLIVAVSQGLARRAMQEFGLSQAQVTVIPNGVDHSIFKPEAATEGDAGRPLPERYLASVGLYIPRKAYPCLLKAFSILATRYPDIHLVAAGNDGPELEPLRGEIDRLGLGPRVHLLQSLSPPQVAHLLARALACVQPALAEGLPLAALEAGAAGTPLVLSNIPGHDEIVDHEVSGMLFPVNDPVACAVATSRILDQPEFGRRLAAAQRAQSLERYTWSTCLASYLAAAGVAPRGPLQ